MTGFKNRKLKRHKLMYCILFRDYLRRDQTDTNIFTFARYKLYKDIIVPNLKAKNKKIKRKGNIRKYYNV